MERYDYLRDCICELVSIAEEFVERERFGELDNAGADIIGLLIELNNYKDAEEQGLLLRLPCKVGDTVYLIKSEGKIVPRTADMQFLGVLWDYYGKEWFLTQEEAEAKLKELKGE